MLQLYEVPEVESPDQGFYEGGDFNISVNS